ncbi:MAG TPA: hypothetical protein VMV69_13070 [Pirellulales bacterium]|nr:hypothetical protein [Pirellulales bacterium]
MSHSSIDSSVQIPFAAQNLFRRYGPAVRAKVSALLREKIAVEGEESLRLDFVCQCIGNAIYELSEAKGSRPKPDPRMVRLSLEAFRKGDYQTTEAFVNEIRNRVAAAD